MRHSPLLRLALVVLPVLFTADIGSAQARLGPGLQATLDALGPAETMTVVVTYGQDGPLTAGQRASLSGLGITQGITFQSLPVAGVVATAVQIDAIANASGGVSAWPNHELTYSNADATDLTGVNGVRTDRGFRQRNGGLAVYDLLGREVAVVQEGAQGAGSHQVRIETGRFAPGAYLVRLDAAGQTAVQRLTVVK